MGNCLNLQKPATWVDDEEDDYWEWESMESSKSRQQQKNKENSSRASVAGATEIRIKISKRQLEELLRQVDSERASLRRALFDLASGGTELSWKDQQHNEQEMGHWKPELPSIPEMPELEISDRNY